MAGHEDPWQGLPETASDASEASNHDVEMPKERETYDNELKTIHLSVLEDMRRQRRRVLAWAMWTTSLLLLLTAVFIGWHMWATHGLADVKLLMAWIASVLAASIGIIASISKFFVRRDGEGDSTPAEDQRLNPWIASTTQPGWGSSSSPGGVRHTRSRPEAKAQVWARYYWAERGPLTQ